MSPFPLPLYNMTESFPSMVYDNDEMVFVSRNNDPAWRRGIDVAVDVTVIAVTLSVVITNWLPVVVIFVVPAPLVRISDEPPSVDGGATHDNTPLPLVDNIYPAVPVDDGNVSD